MKTTKPEWIATNDDGGKLFYFKELGWVDAKDGLVTPDTLTVGIVQPEGATHIQIYKGRVNFLRCNWNDTGYSLWNTDHWLCVGAELSGRVFPLEEQAEPVAPFGNDWFEHSGSYMPPFPPDCIVEVQVRDGSRAVGPYNSFKKWVWGHGNGDVMRWRYASTDTAPETAYPWNGHNGGPAPFMLIGSRRIEVQVRNGGMTKGFLKEFKWRWLGKNDGTGTGSDVMRWRYA